MIKRPDNITTMMGDDNNELYTEGIKDFLKDISTQLSDAYHMAKAGKGKETEALADAAKSRKRIKDAHDDVRDNPSYQQHLDTINTYNDEIGAQTADALDTIAKKVGKGTVRTSSIVARARKSVLQFPIYITQTLRVNEAHIIGKLFERVYASLVQTVMSQNPYIDEDEANDLVFLKQFHTNLRESGELVLNEYYTPIDTIDEIMSESVFYSEQLSPFMTVEFRKLDSLNPDLVKENARLLNEPLTGFTYLREAESKEPEKEKEVEKEWVWEPIRDSEIRDMAKAELRDSGDAAYRDADATERKRIEDRKIEEIQDKIRAGKYSGLEYKNARYQRAYKKGSKSVPLSMLDKNDKSNDKSDDKPKRVEKGPDVPMLLLKDSDIKKTNGMLPYQMAVTFRVRAKDGKIDKDVTYVLGVKSVMHLIRVQDLADELRDLIMGNSKTLQKVRYKTGEIGFLDYMFNIKGLKADAAKRVNGNKKWLNTLKRLGEYNKMNGSLLKEPIKAITGGDVPIPNGTLVLSQSDVTTLVNQTGIDLSVVRNAKNLARTLFLIAVVIVDSSAGSMRVLFPDSDTDWDVQSLASIDAEIAKTDNSQIMRELNRMVNK